MKKWNLIIDVDKCNNCNNCFLSAKDEHVGNDFPGYAAPQPKHGHHWIELKRAEHGAPPMIDVVNVPTMCNHCADAPCVKAGKGAVIQREDGIVIIDPIKARGRRDIVESCPYHAVWWNEELQLPQAWIFDAHLLDNGWKVPRCEQACPTAAIRAVKIDDAAMEELIKVEQLEVLNPEFGTRPRVHYRNLHRYNRWFVAGSISAQVNGMEECIEGIEVRLSNADGELAKATTDAYGEFRLVRLPPEPAEYILEFFNARRQLFQKNIVVERSEYLGNYCVDF